MDTGLGAKRKRRWTLGTAANLVGPLSVMLLCAPVLAQESPSEVAARVHSQGGYGDDIRFVAGQHGELQHFPGGSGGGEASERLDAPPGSGGVGRYERGQGFEAGESRESGRLFPEISLDFGKGVQVVFVVLFCLVIVVLLVLLARQYGRPNRTIAPPAEPSPKAKIGQQVLPWNAGDPDQLAAEGRYREAIVALLVQAMKLVGWREDERSHTAREVLMRMLLEDPSRVPMNIIVGRSERVRFAGAPADLDAFNALKVYVAEVVRLQGHPPAAIGPRS